MAAVALTILDQGGPGPAGRAFAGTVAGGLVTVTNDNNTDVLSWAITLLDVPPDSALVPGVLATADSGTPTASFTPDVVGSFRVMLDVYEATGLTGIRNRDIRNFGIPNARGIIVPPYQKLPDPLPVTGSGQPGEKPDEQNYGGQTRGWAGDRASGQLEQYFQTYDDLPIELVGSTPFTAAATGEPPLYMVFLVIISSDAVFNLPSSGVRVGQRYRVIAEAGTSFKVAVTVTGGQNINGLSSVDMPSGGSGTFLYLGGLDWIMLGHKTDRYERTLVGGVEDTDQTGFVSIGSTVLDIANFTNVATVTWQAVLETTNAADAAEIRLFDVTGAAIVGASTLSTVSLTPVLVSATITLPPGSNLYEVQLRLQTTGTPNRATCKQAQLIIDWLQP